MTKEVNSFISALQVKLYWRCPRFDTGLGRSKNNLDDSDFLLLNGKYNSFDRKAGYNMIKYINVRLDLIGLDLI